MTVKEVLQSLVDDNMVDCERVGTSNYYWAFPSKALHARKRKLEELQQQVTDRSARTSTAAGLLGSGTEPKSRWLCVPETLGGFSGGRSGSSSELGQHVMAWKNVSANRK